MNYPRYPAYKDSGVAWLGQIPAHWELSSIKRGYDVQLGKMLQPEANNLEDIEVSYLKAQHVQWEKVITETLPTMWADLVEIDKYKVQSGDLLVLEGGEAGRCAILKAAPNNCIIQNALHRVRGIDNNDVHYLQYIIGIAARSDWLNVICNKATIMHFTSDKLVNLPCLYPPLAEQRAIAAFLDGATARIDTLIARQTTLIALLHEKRAALISHAVTRGLDRDAPLKDSGVAWLGMVPAHWLTATLKHVVSIPITDGPHETPEFLNEGVAFLSAEAIKNGKLNFNLKRGYISPQLHSLYAKKCQPLLNDIFMVKSGNTTGNIAIVETNEVFAIWSPLALIRCNISVILPRYVYLFMQSQFFQTTVSLSASYGTQPNIGMGVIENLYVAYPGNLAEQQEIVSYLDRETAKLDALIDKAQTAIALLREHRAALIAAAVTGAIDAREMALTPGPSPSAGEGSRRSDVRD